MDPSLRVNEYGGCKEPPPDRDTRRLIGHISLLNQYESQIPLCKTIDEVEEIRGFSQGIQSYARECGDAGKTLVAWARRCAMLCQLRITEIQKEQKARKEARTNGELSPITNSANGEVSTTANFVSLRKEFPSFRSDAKLVSNLPKEQLEKHMESSQSIRVIADKVRKERGPKKPKSTPEELEKARARYYKKKALASASNSAAKLTEKPKRDLHDIFRLYWTKEKDLLLQFFGTADFGKIESKWIDAFHKLQQDVEQATQERENARAKLKNKKPSDAVGATPDAEEGT
jgi:hypothetical protein